MATLTYPVTPVPVQSPTSAQWPFIRIKTFRVTPLPVVAATRPNTPNNFYWGGLNS